MRYISVLGSTGSIGTQTLDVIRRDGDLKAVALAASSNVSLMKRQIEEFGPELVAMYDEEKARELSEILKKEKINCRVMSGMEGLVEAASYEKTDLTVVSVVGMIGIEPTISAIKAGKDIALANKETLVCAGHIIMPLVKKYGVKLLPVDSEHSAVFQCLAGEEHDSIEKLILTASGGPFRGYTKEMLREVTLEQALSHPNWSMGRKITIDSASMVNKGLEVMEAHWLFDVPYENIEVLVQPKSIIHSMVQFKDGAVKAQLGVPDMRIPIEYAIYAPRRVYISESSKPDFSKLTEITFEKPDVEVFRGLKLGIEAGKTGGSMPTVYNAANEEAVALFLDGRIGFTDITEVIEETMRNHRLIKNPTFKEVLEAEKEARNSVKGRFNI